MISTSKLTMNFGGTPLFEDVNIKFIPGNCYGLIGANGAGKSTFLKMLSGELEPTSGEVIIPGKQRLAKLEQDQFKFDAYSAIDTVLMGHPKLYEVHKERQALYEKADFSEEDGLRASELEMAYADFNGYEAESEAASLLHSLGLSPSLHGKHMGELESGEKVRVLLAQALFGRPDILLLDEPTNNLDTRTVSWLEGHLQTMESLVIVVSHDRHFLNHVCTHIADIDFRNIRIYAGNYDFWLEASELALRQRRDEQKKNTDKAKELQAFIARFSSNASKARQATARKKLLDDLTLDELPQSTRKYPHITFKPSRPQGKVILTVDKLSHRLGDEVLFKDLSFMVNPDDRIGFLGDGRAISALFDIIAEVNPPQTGSIEWGQTMSHSYFPKDNEVFFKDVDLSLVDWLRQFTEVQDEEFVRGFLGRMLFSGDDSQKAAKVLSGGEKVRCMLSKMMQSGANALIFDDPTNHLDLESITALNKGLVEVKDSVILLSSHDRELIETVANRIIEITPKGIIDENMSFGEYLESPRVAQQREALL